MPVVMSWVHPPTTPRAVQGPLSVPFSSEPRRFQLFPWSGVFLSAFTSGSPRSHQGGQRPLHGVSAPASPFPFEYTYCSVHTPTLATCCVIFRWGLPRSQRASAETYLSLSLKLLFWSLLSPCWLNYTELPSPNGVSVGWGCAGHALSWPPVPMCTRKVGKNIHPGLPLLFPTCG